MSFLLGVEIDHSRLVWIYNSAQPVEKAIQLTTVTENQRKADIKFYIKHSDTKSLLCTESISNIPSMKAGEPSIDVKSRVTNKTFFYEIYLNGRLILNGSHSIRKYLRSRKPVLIAAAILALLGLAALIIFWLLPVYNSIKEKPELINKPEAKFETVIKPDPKPEAIPEQISEEEIIEKEIEPEINNLVFIESEITDRYSVYFQPESSELTPEAISGLKVFINKLPRETDFEEAQFELEIRGHCARYGSEEGRAELSKERATTVYFYLKSGWGIEADSFVTGAGASEPVSLKRDEQHLNRRVDINIKGNIKKRETTN